MTDTATLEERLRTVERALADGNHDLDGVAEAAAAVDRIEEIDERVADLQRRVEDLEAATQAVRGYVGNVRSVNDDIEGRADAALAAVDRLEDRLDRLDERLGDQPEPTRPNTTTADRSGRVGPDRRAPDVDVDPASPGERDSIRETARFATDEDESCQDEPGLAERIRALL